jgi:hypothetical protein
MKEKTTLSQAREVVARLLPSALIKSAGDYDVLMAQKETVAAKIKTHYLALKSCAAHIEQLLKIAALAEKEEENADDLPTLLKAAQAEIDSFKR